MAAPIDQHDSKSSPALSLEIVAECSTTKARTCKISLPHCLVHTPVFMPVGTQGTMKGVTSTQLEELGCELILGNTYHLGMRPGPDLMDKVGGLHKFMNWNRALLTDSGGFQMVSLVELSEVTEEGVKFQSPYTKEELMLTPEKSIEIQNSIGADIMMQLDDVVHSLTKGPRVEEAMHSYVLEAGHKEKYGMLTACQLNDQGIGYLLQPINEEFYTQGLYDRSIRWLDRCIKANKRLHEQNLFAIIQGGLDAELRTFCAKEMVKRDTPGYAIGGLSGGEEKDHFWRMVTLSTDYLPKNKPRYCMGVGYAVDLVVCCALGVDMFDCVFPTRTARFGSALIDSGQLNLKTKTFSCDLRPIDDQCPCFTCQNHSRAYLHCIIQEAVSAQLLSIHNIAFQMRLMKRIRESIAEDRFPEFIKTFMTNVYPSKVYPKWVKESLESVNVFLES